MQVHPTGTGGTCTDPGVNADDGEAAIDVEWASAAAPNAAIELASCADTSTNFGGFIALQNLLSESGTPPAIVSISYGEAETALGATSNAYISSLYQQDVDCTGTHNCYTPSGTYGGLSTSNSALQAAYAAGVGWDFATGIGTVNANNLVMAFGSPAATRTPHPTATAP